MILTRLIIYYLKSILESEQSSSYDIICDSHSILIIYYLKPLFTENISRNFNFLIFKYPQYSLFLECLPPCFTMILSLLVKELQLSTINETTSSSGELCRHLSNVFNETTSSSGGWGRHFFQMYSTPQDHIFFRWKDIFSNV